MPAKFKVAHDYRSSTVTLREGQTVELDDELAAWIERDSPGILQPAQKPREETAADGEEADTRERAPSSPERDRQVKKPRNKRTTKKVEG